MSQRLGLRAFHTLRQNATTSTVRRQPFAARTTRYYSDAAAPAQSKLQQFWHSPIGPKTVHFWAPIMKWGVVLAGAADFLRPASSLSISQNAALMATGAIWTRWCFIIKPQNLFLASVNFLLFCVGATQVSRVLLYRQSLDKESVGDEIKDAAKEEGKSLEKVAEKVEGKVKS
ncbi:Mitochondrial pyruvate carrier-like protein 2 [Elsinoe fawcettii]|nr:Mitochondrial pyruvate carrier-like protein 2 [Elsinoe fawcettii]